MLTRAMIGEAALQIAGAEGFPAVTMNRLAREFDVTPGALYNHVRDRQEVIDLAAGLLMQLLPDPTFEADDWREALRDAYRTGRAAYRLHPRALLVALDETVTASEVPLKRFELAETMLAFFVRIGLTIGRAQTLREAFLQDLFAHALLVDHLHESVPEEPRLELSRPVPQAWLAAQPDADLPLSRRAAELPPRTADDLFDDMVELRIAAIERLLNASS